MDEAESNTKPGAKPRKKAEYRSKILIVDDNPQYAKIFELLSDELKIDAHIVGSCDDALKALDKTAFDLIIMDWLMPDVDGPACTRKIRLNKARKHIPVIGVTGYLKANHSLCLEAGMDDYLAIPFTYDQLEAKLKEWLKQKKT